jgi:protein-S-isoprenylcysteine O-methyltransferase Ste14
VVSPVVVRSLSLLVPVVLTWALLLYRRPDGRLAGAAGLASLWVLAASFAVNLLAIRIGSWSFEAEGGVLAGVPIDLWLGWTLLWGAIPILAFGSVPLWLTIAAVVWSDLVLMPASAPVVQLGPAWLGGEAMSVALCLLPAQLLARWTRDNRRLAARILQQVVLFSSLSLWVLPLIIMAEVGGDFGAAVQRPTWVLSLAVQLLAVPATMGAAAVLEFCRHGRGTPFPWDPPSRLVTSGPYAYVANPMQLSMTIILAGFGMLLGSVPVALAGLVAGLFGAGFARWQEHGDLDERYGQDWHDYRAAVRAWLPRWRPAATSTATLYYAASCIECSAVGSWFIKQQPISLHLMAAEAYPGTAPTRITYVAADGSVFAGVAALSRAVDHLNLAWAWVGWASRMPGVSQVVQLVVDAVGGGPRTIRFLED